MKKFTCVQDIGDLKSALAEAFEIKKDRFIGGQSIGYIFDVKQRTVEKLLQRHSESLRNLKHDIYGVRLISLTSYVVYALRNDSAIHCQTILRHILFFQQFVYPRSEGFVEFHFYRPP